MLSRTSEYALRAVVCLAQHHDTSLTTRQIADCTKVPYGYLAKVLASLSRAKIIRSRRGIQGGYVLAADPSRLTILDVTSVVDPVRRIRKCPLGLEDHATELCSLHKHLDDVLATAEREFSRLTVMGLLSEPCGVRPLTGEGACPACKSTAVVMTAGDVPVPMTGD